MQRLLRTFPVFTSLPGIIPFLLEMTSASAILFNITVDDSSPDPFTGNAIIYTGHWDAGRNCSSCVEKPDPVQAYNSSWHDASYFPSNYTHNNMNMAAFTFIGSALYVYGILPVTHWYGSDIRFFVDDQPMGNFSYYEPSGDNDGRPEDRFKFNVPLFVADLLPYGSHSLKIANGREGGQASLILLDYIIYTARNDTPTSALSELPSLATSIVPSMQNPASATSTQTASSAPANTSTPVLPISIGLLAALLVIFGLVTVACGTWLCIQRRKNRNKLQMPRREYVVSGLLSDRSSTLYVPSHSTAALGALPHPSATNVATVGAISHICVGQMRLSHTDITKGKKE